MPFFTQNRYLDVHRDAIKPEAEEYRAVFRFNDFNPKGQSKFAAWFKEDSSVRTIRNKAKEGDIIRVLRDLNPVILSGNHYNGSFSNSNFYRWKERVFSSMIFNSLFRRNPRNTENWDYRHFLATPHFALQGHNNKAICDECGEEFEPKASYEVTCLLCELAKQESNMAWREAAQQYARGTSTSRKHGGHKR